MEGLYGSITRTGTARVLAALGVTPSSHLVDVGAGLGRHLLHALASPGVAAASGVELDAVKVEKAGAFAEQAAAGLAARGASWALPSLPDVQCAPVEAMPTLDPATHAYSFWEGVPPGARAAFGRLVAGSATVAGVAVVQRAMRGRDPADKMEALGFGALTLTHSFAVSMGGSGRSFTAYVFSRQVDKPVSLETACRPLPRALVAPGAAGASAAPCARGARRARRREGVPAPAPPLPPPARAAAARGTADIRSFVRARRAAPGATLAAACAAPLPATPKPAARASSTSPAKVTASPSRGVAKAAVAGRPPRGLGAALLQAAAAGGR